MIASKQIAFGGGGKKKEEEAPAHWGLCFTAEEAGSTVSMASNVYSLNLTLETSYDGENWVVFYPNDTTITLPNIGNKVYFRAGENGNSGFGTGASMSQCSHFTMSGCISASGSIQSLLNGREPTYEIKSTYCFCYLFLDCASLITAPELPATTLGAYCYRGLFRGCSSLVEPPILPAMDLNSQCYLQMFFDCYALERAPELPATTLVSNCYTQMFTNCTSLLEPPKLPATILGNTCYLQMFSGCTSLEYAPELPATTLVSNCYNTMFKGCSKISRIKTRQSSFTGCSNWLVGVRSSGVFICPTVLGTDETITRGVSGCPDGWTVINED